MKTPAVTMFRSKENLHASILWLAIGGLTVFVVPFLKWLYVQDIPNLQFLLLIFSFPHFMQTYFLFYRKQELWMQHKLVSIVAPILIIAVIASTRGHRTPELILLQAAMILFFWHISRQAFGVAWHFVKNEYRSKNLRTLVLATPLLFAVAGWLHFNANANQVYVFKSWIDPLNLPNIYYQILQLVAWFVLSVLVVVLFLRSRRNGNIDARGFVFSVTPLFALAAWLHPLSLIGAYGLIPVFHGIQYLGFAVVTLEMGAIIASVSLVICGLVGWGVFQVLPGLFIGSEANAAWIVSGIYIFLNVHHFFIDSVIWKGSKKPLMTFGSKREPQQSK